MPGSSSSCPPNSQASPQSHQIHATCIVVGDTGVLLRGKPGSGKSDLALRMIDRGARLIADDRTDLSLGKGGRVIARSPAAIKGRMEVRGLGIEEVPSREQAEIDLVVDLVGAGEVERLPDPDFAVYLGRRLPLLRLDPFENSAPAKLALAARHVRSHKDSPMSDPSIASKSNARRRVVVVTGLSGAGRSSALHILEDFGYEAIDNPPLSLLDTIVTSDGAERLIAVGLDARSRHFATEPLLRRLDHLASHNEIKSSLLFLECEDEVLRRRYTETRRRHPMAQDRPVFDGISAERRLLLPLRQRADVTIDTSALTLGRLREVLAGHFSLGEVPTMAISVLSFSFRHGLPREADLVFDVRFLRNPHYEPELRLRDGRDPSVADFVERDTDFGPFLEQLIAMLTPLLPRYEKEGKSYLTIAFGCTGGRHRSVMLAERIAAWLREHDRQVNLVHRDIERASHGDSA